MLNERYDEIPINVIKGVWFIEDITCILFNKSFYSGIFLDALKILKTIRLFKNDDKNKMNNYRPISLSTVTSKILEILIKVRLTSFVKYYNILSKSQFDICTNTSTASALTEAVDFVLNSVDNRCNTAGLFFVLKKAFGCVDYNNLLTKLKLLGIRCVLLNCMKTVY